MDKDICTIDPLDLDPLKKIMLGSYFYTIKKDFHNLL